MTRCARRYRYITRLLAGLVAWALVARCVLAADIGVIGLFPGKAVLVIDGASPKTFAVGSHVADGVKLLGVDASSAVFEEHGKRQKVSIGTHVSHADAGNASSVTLQADGRGHFVTPVQINGLTMPMLVDTGATLITLSSQQARRLGIDYRSGQHGYSNTANGRVEVYQVRLDNVRVGPIELNQVDAAVQESGLPFGLLGMSFLNRTQMRREGEQMVLSKRY